MKWKKSIDDDIYESESHSVDVAGSCGEVDTEKAKQLMNFLFDGSLEDMIVEKKPAIEPINTTTTTSTNITNNIEISISDTSESETKDASETKSYNPFFSFLGWQ